MGKSSKSEAEMLKRLPIAAHGNQLNGEGGIRTRGKVLPLRRFSKAVLSTTQPPLRVVSGFYQPPERLTILDRLMDGLCARGVW